MASVVLKKPIGWWISYRKDRWEGPYSTRAEAIEVAKYLVPAQFTQFTLLQVAAWDEKVIKINEEPDVTQGS